MTLVAACLLLAAAPQLASAAEDDLQLLSRADGDTGLGGDMTSETASISDDGCRIVFNSFATNFGAGYTSGLGNVFVRDVCAIPKKTILVSQPTGTAGPAANGTSVNNSAISGDGRYVAFASTANNLDPVLDEDLTTNGADTDIFVRDLDAAIPTTTLVSIDDAETTNVHGQVFGGQLGISEHGGHVAWTSDTPATTVTGAADINGSSDVFLRDVLDETSTLVSRVNATNTAGNQASFWPSISNDGTRVAFDSYATDLDGGGTGSDIFYREVAAGPTTLVSRAAGEFGAIGSGYSQNSEMSADGGTVVFESNSTNFGGGTASLNVYARDLDAPFATEFINRKSGVAGDPQVSGQALGASPSVDGRFISFNVDYFGEALSEGATSVSLYVRDRVNKTTLSRQSQTGRHWRRRRRDFDRPAGDSADGHFIAFTTSATNLSADDNNPFTFVDGANDVYLREIDEPTVVTNGATVNLRPLEGVPSVALPGGGVVDLEHSTQFPLGSVVDTTSARLEVTSDNLAKESMVFFGGQFAVSQPANDPATTLTLPAATGCPPVASTGTGSNTGTSSKKKKKKKKKKRLETRAVTKSLFGKGKGTFRTRGGRGSATVRGTEFFTEERCEGTFFRLDSGGPLEIDDFGLGSLADVTLTVPGSSYLAAVPAPPAEAPKTCKRGFKLKTGKCVKKKKKNG